MGTMASEASSWDDLSLTVSAVARRMGVAPATLRTWDRRYGVGPSDHQPGAHRRYTTADVARLEHMRKLVIAGVPPADAARAALALTGGDLSLADGESRRIPQPIETSTARSGGGNVIALPGGGPLARGLARAAQALDIEACQQILAEALTDLGVVQAWEDVMVPVLGAVGERWRDTGRGVEIEHALSGAVQDSLSSWIRGLAPSTEGRAVILACAPGDQHSLPLWAVSAALAEQGVGARILGANLPEDALSNAVRRLGPAAVLVWAQVEETADARTLMELPTTRPPATILVAGPGWHSLPSAPGVSRVATLDDAVDRIRYALGR
jgi:DNA-binding transcriptional MerR regulator